MGRSRYHVTENAVPYFHTCTIVGWLPILVLGVDYFEKTTKC